MGRGTKGIIAKLRDPLLTLERLAALGTVGSWEWGGLETGGAWPGWMIAFCAGPTSCLQMSQHIFVMSPIKFSPVPPPRESSVARKTQGPCVSDWSVAPLSVQEAAGGLPEVSTHLAGVHRGGDAVRKQGFQPESGIPQRRLGRKGQVCRACERTQSKQNDLTVIITGINNMSSEFFSILDLVFMFLTNLGSLKKKKRDCSLLKV